MFQVKEIDCIKIEEKLLYNIWQEQAQIKDLLKLLTTKENKEGNISTLLKDKNSTEAKIEHYICKVCGKEHTNKGDLLVCARKHKKEGKQWQE